MDSALEEAKAALTKSKDDMAKYYGQRCTPAPDYKPGDKVYSDASDIQTNRPSRRLSHHRLGPFPIVKKVRNGAYQLRLPPMMSRLHPVFNVVKLTPALIDPIEGHHPHPPPLPEIVDREEEWIIEAILDSKMMNRRLCYLVKWEGFGAEHNSWEPWDNNHAPGLVADFHQKCYDLWTKREFNCLYLCLVLSKSTVIVQQSSKFMSSFKPMFRSKTLRVPIARYCLRLSSSELRMLRFSVKS